MPQPTVFSVLQETYDLLREFGAFSLCDTPNEPAMDRYRNFCFTVNNASAADKEALQTLWDSGRLRYLCFGMETGSSGTPHLQGYVCYGQNHKRTVVACRDDLGGRAHVEIARGSHSQASEYCKKDGSFVEHGTLPADDRRMAGGAANAERYAAAVALAKRGVIDEIPSDLLVRHYNAWKSIRQDNQIRVPDAVDCTGVWYVGPPGSGKSRTARDRFPSAYLKQANKWWDGYPFGSDTAVILEELAPEHKWMANHVKLWADRYAFMGETKGGQVMLRPKVICVTSNYEITDIWDGVDAQAITRRFRIERFPQHAPPVMPDEQEHKHDVVPAFELVDALGTPDFPICFD